MNISVIGSCNVSPLSGAFLGGFGNDVQSLNVFLRNIAKPQQGSKRS